MTDYTKDEQGQQIESYADRVARQAVERENELDHEQALTNYDVRSDDMELANPGIDYEANRREWRASVDAVLAESKAADADLIRNDDSAEDAQAIEAQDEFAERHNANVDDYQQDQDGMRFGDAGDEQTTAEKPTDSKSERVNAIRAAAREGREQSEAKQSGKAQEREAVR